MSEFPKIAMLPLNWHYVVNCEADWDEVDRLFTKQAAILITIFLIPAVCFFTYIAVNLRG
jgi:hypothetical protein